MSKGIFKVPTPVNEPILGYLPGSPEREDLVEKIGELKSQPVEIPIIIGGEEIKTGNTVEIVCPHDFSTKLGTYHQGGTEEVAKAIEVALEARKKWAAMPWEHRVSIYLRAAHLLTGPWRSTLNAATMLGQSKTVFQAEIDSACELIDFWRFNCHYLREIMADQPDSDPGIWNRLEYRPLEGFILAITPFNFTSIAANLCTAPALVGNVAVWKPSPSAVYSGYYLMKLFEAAGFPKGVINFVPGDAETIVNAALDHPDFGGLHYTGSTGVFRGLWKKIGDRMDKYRSYPRIVGETGGKDFIFAHPSSDIDALVVAALRGAFEFQGQKCSAASRLYIPQSLWGEFKEKYVAEVAKIKVGDVTDFTNFIGAVIHREAYDKIKGYIEHARQADDAEIITGGNCTDEKGFFIEPTTIVTTNPRYKSIEEEIFGPVLTIYVYEDSQLNEAIHHCESTSPYALTGSIFGRDREALVEMSRTLENAAGNFYINDKPTGAVVGQQPFGGARASGTNDKAGAPMNLLRWMSARTIKENLVPPTSWDYGYMKESQ